jgi:Protein phosphatase 2C
MVCLPGGVHRFRAGLGAFGSPANQCSRPGKGCANATADQISVSRQPVRFSLRDSISLAGGRHNEDRFGLYGAAAWVVDGATDVLEERLLPGPSDAAWFAEALNRAFARLAEQPAPSCDAVLVAATEEVRSRFQRAAVRAVAQRHEQPSAAGIYARIVGGALEGLSLGDCTMMTLPAGAAPLDLFRAGRREADDDTRAAAKAMTAGPGGEHASPQTIRAGLMPLLRAGRDRMNTPEGYGVFSIDMPPGQHVRHCRRPVGEGDLFLLASDGFLRLVDVYGAHSLPSLAAAIHADGLAALALHLRGIETEDAGCRRFPRAKVRDDATAMIVEVTA